MLLHYYLYLFIPKNDKYFFTLHDLKTTELQYETNDNVEDAIGRWLQP